MWEKRRWRLKPEKEVGIWLEALSLAAFDEAGCHSVNSPMGRPTRQGTEGGLWLAASEELRPSVQQPKG